MNQKGNGGLERALARKVLVAPTRCTEKSSRPPQAKSQEASKELHLRGALKLAVAFLSETMKLSSTLRLHGALKNRCGDACHRDQPELLSCTCSVH